MPCGFVTFEKINFIDAWFSPLFQKTVLKKFKIIIIIRRSKTLIIGFYFYLIYGLAAFF